MMFGVAAKIVAALPIATSGSANVLPACVCRQQQRDHNEAPANRGGDSVHPGFHLRVPSSQGDRLVCLEIKWPLACFLCGVHLQGVGWPEGWQICCAASAARHGPASGRPCIVRVLTATAHDGHRIWLVVATSAGRASSAPTGSCCFAVAMFKRQVLGAAICPYGCSVAALSGCK